jgi:hypothetical protein
VPLGFGRRGEHRQAGEQPAEPGHHMTCTSGKPPPTGSGERHPPPHPGKFGSST